MEEANTLREQIDELLDNSVHSTPTSRNQTLSPKHLPERHHREGQNFSSPPPEPPGLGLNGEPRCTAHPTRSSNLSSLKREKRPALKLPPPNDAVWGTLNSKLEKSLELRFPLGSLASLPIATTSVHFQEFIYEFMEKEFGTKDTGAKIPVRRKPRQHVGLARLRKQKRELKALRKLLGNKHPHLQKKLQKQWHRLLRKHSALSRAVRRKTRARESRAAANAFKKDPNDFASKLFKGQGASATPQFSEEQAKQYFAKTYRDENRNFQYTALKGMVRPPPPKHAIQIRPPTVLQLLASAKRKRNGAAAGLDAMTYVVYKKLPCTMTFLHRLGVEMWNRCQVADDWAQAFMALLKKGSLLEDLEKVEEFRPITMTATLGKIWLSTLSTNLQRFLVKNSYIPRKIQKGFLSGISGCVEHTFMLFEAMKEAKEAKRQMVVAWLDLANAYGSVRHNLVQFALEWYHVPKRICKLVFDYYEKLMAKVVTKGWSTDFFLFDIGLFQGCVLSSILFICVFQLLIDFLAPHREECGFKFDQAAMKALTEAYADDLALIAKDAAAAQTVTDETQKWLEWTDTMKAKPRKCICMGMKQFDKRIKPNGAVSKYVPVRQDVQYSLFNPKLFIAGKKMIFILQPNKGAFKGTHFKFLGRWICHNLKEIDVKRKIRSELEADLKLVESSKVNGLMKLWLYQFGILSHLAWPFLIHDLDISFAKNLQTTAQRYLKKWSGVNRTVDPGVMYRTRKNLGLQLTAVSDHYVNMQVIKCQQLATSLDPAVRRVWVSKTDKEQKMTQHFRASQLNTVASAQVELNTKFAGQVGRQGLGSGNYNNDPSAKDKRKMVAQAARSFAEDERMAHAVQLSQQGCWTKWHEKVVPFDLSWKNLIYGPGPHVIKFVLNATVNWLDTPDNLRKWGYKTKEHCCICFAENCTIHHIISNCGVSLTQKRYTWRHDSILLGLRPILEELVANANKVNAKSVKARPPLFANFVAAGEHKTPPKVSKPSLLSMTNDWRLLIDFGDDRIVFPPLICATPLRPDIVLWSYGIRQVIMIELTCPAEEGIEPAQERKKARYFDLKCQCQDANWSPTLLTIEVGARGYVADTVPICLKRLGLSPRKTRQVCKTLADIVSRCTYTIFLARKSKTWAQQRPLLSLNPASTAELQARKPARADRKQN
jgi:hypothetical protein